MSTKKLKISDDLSLPIDAATETFGILGRRGSGKSHTGSVMAEEMLKVSVPIVAYDPTGAWYGLKSSVDGKSPGFPVVIFGGEHADVPLNEQDGEMIARAIVAERFPAILDCSLLRKGARLRMMADFLETLYHENRDAVHFFADELHTIAPLMLKSVGEASVFQNRCVGAIEDIILQGRRRGIGMTGMSQRPALVNANVRSQFGTLIAMQMNAPLDRKAIAEWIAEKGTEEEGEKLLAELPRLEKGTGIVWSTVFGILKRVKFRQRETFDSGRTPGVGEKRIEPKAWAEIDINKLGATIAAKREEKKANDPKELHRQLAELKKQLANVPTPKPVEKVKEVQILGDAHVKRLETIAERLASEGHRLVETGEKMLAEAAAVRQTITSATARMAGQSAPVRIMRPSPQVKPTPARVHAPREAGTATATEVGTGGLRRILTALAQRPGLTNRQIGVRAGLSSKSGTYATYLGRARSNGWIRDEGDRRFITDEGLAALGDYDPLPSGADLLGHWRNELGDGGIRRILDALADAHPSTLSNEQIGEAAGISHASGTFATYMGRLRSLELIQGGRGQTKASDEFFE